MNVLVWGRSRTAKREGQKSKFEKEAARPPYLDPSVWPAP